MVTARWPCVLFDLDGTVADTVALIMASYDHALNNVIGHSPDPAEVKTWIGRTLWATFGEYWPSQAAELVDTYRTWNRANAPRLITGYPGVAELVADLAGAGIRVGIATSKGRDAAEETLQLAGVDLPVTVAMEDTELHKPNPEPILLALQRLGGAVGAAVYVGDAVVDVEAARAAGLDSIAVTWGAGDADALAAAAPTALASTVAELRELLLGDPSPTAPEATERS